MLRNIKKTIMIAFVAVTGLLPGKLLSQTPQQIQYDAEDIEFDKRIANGAYRLLRHVVFKHKNTTMYCDSAYFYASENSLEAFSNVYINHADSAHIYGDYLFYDGNIRNAKIKKNVRLNTASTSLKSQSLEYDLQNNIGYYTNHADIVTGENKLKSRIGIYYSRTSDYLFRDSVVVINPKYTIYSDTLRYNTVTHVAYFIGPTHIVSDTSTIYCESGWYNTKTNISFLKKNTRIENPMRVLTSDSIYYERETGFGEAFSNITLVDNEQNIILKGNYARINEKQETAILTDSALLIYITRDDSVYIHADTLRSDPDSTGKKEFRLYYKVKLFKSNMQGKCDSLFYSSADSIIRLFYSPVLWSGENQLSSEYIEIHIKNKQVHELHMRQLAFIVNQEDSIRFNQVKGKSMICHFENNELSRIDVFGNGQTVYYAKDKEDIIGVNKAESSNLIIFMKDNNVEEIRFINKPQATLYPLELAPPEEVILKDFKWCLKARPVSKEDIFNWVPE
jgi:lipopolysaccharide export system protein LptA